MPVGMLKQIVGNVNTFSHPCKIQAPLTMTHIHAHKEQGVVPKSYIY